MHKAYGSHRHISQKNSRCSGLTSGGFYKGDYGFAIAELEARQIIVQRGGRIWAGVYLCICP